MKKTILAANWKMYLNENESVDFINKMNQEDSSFFSANVILFPSHTCINQVQKNLGTENIKIGMQDCDINTEGAYTGAVSLHSLSDIDFCIVGHSERRLLYNESDEVVKDKLETVTNNNVSAILCIGETKEQKNDGNTFKVIDRQLSILPKDAINSLTIAYEPVWAIGTGEVASIEEINKMHSFVKNLIKINDYNSLHNSFSFYYRIIKQNCFTRLCFKSCFNNVFKFMLLEELFYCN